MTATAMDPDWRPFHPNPRRPRFIPPAGAVDAHCHVFGPAARFPFAPQRKYTPCDATVEQLWALRDHLGLSRNVIVQASCHGSDNAALLEALRRSEGLARGVVTLNGEESVEELAAMHEAGVRGVRFNFVKRLVDALPFERLEKIVERVQPLGWHLIIYFEAQDLAELRSFFVSLPTLVVVDHMGRPDVSQDVEGGDFEQFISLLEDHDNFWSKVSCAERLSKSGPPDYRDVIPFSRRLVEAFPNRVLWGTDWPHPNMKSHMPDDGDLVDLIPEIARTEELQRKLLIDNPMRLYWS